MANRKWRAANPALVEAPLTFHVESVMPQTAFIGKRS